MGLEAGVLADSVAFPFSRTAPAAASCCSAYVKGYILQLAVLANHQNGRDTHVRQVSSTSAWKFVPARVRERGRCMGLARPGLARAVPPPPPLQPRPSHPVASHGCPPTAQVKVYGPQRDPVRSVGHPISFTSPEIAMYATVR